MRILALSLKNLNSLQGEWHIDFRHLAYSENGIFAITGQTGAGKSTILDAICLALYGQTPRLKEITINKNDIMSRQTGECFAKVIFSTKGKTYLCDWSQRKARSKAEGNLQRIKHTIAIYKENSDFSFENLDKNEADLLESNKEGTVKKIEEITGMDFQQFTRSMLLAQGSFAVFLQAKSEERSEILEQITGSEIYSEISIRVNSHRSEAKKALDLLQAEQSGKILLTAEEEQQALETKKDLTHQISQIKQQNDLFIKIKNWQINVQNTQAEISQNQLNLEKLNQQIAEFAPQRTRLNLAQKALEVAGEYAKLTHDRQQHAKLVQQQTQYQAQLPILQQQFTEQNQKLTDAQTAKQQAEQSYQIALPKLNNAKKLMVQIENLQQQMTQNQQQHTAQINEQMDLANLLEQGNADLTELQNQQHQYQDEQKTLANHATLPEVVANLRQYLQTLTASENELASLQHQQTQSHHSLQTLTQAFNQNQHQLANFTHQTAQLQADITTQNQQLQQILVGKTGDDWHAQANILLQAKNSLSNIHQQWQNIEQLQQTKNEIEQEQGSTQSALATIESENVKLENDFQKQTQLVELLGEKLLVQAKIDNLESQRENLIDGEPCPLCGSTEHPYATQKLISQANSIKTELTTAKKQLKILETETKNTGLKQNSLSEKIQQIQQTLIKNEQNLTNQFQQLKNSLSDFNKNFTQTFSTDTLFSLQEKSFLAKISTSQKLEIQAFFQSGFPQNLNQFQSIIGQHQATINQKISQIQPLQNQIIRLKNELETQQRNLSQLEKSQNEIANKKNLEEKNLQHLAEQIAKLSQTNQQTEDKVRQVVQPFAEFLPAQIIVNFAKNLPHIIDILSQRQQYWQNLEHALHANAQAITALHTRLQHQDEQYHKNAKNLAEQAQNIQQDEQILAERKKEKFSLIGDINIEQEEQRLVESVELAKNALFSAEKTVQKTEQEIVNLQQNLAQISQELASLSQSLNEQQASLQQRWNALGFADEQAFLQANLAENERQNLANTARQFDEKWHFLNQQNADLQRKLSDLHQHEITQSAKDITAEQLANQLTQVTQELEILQQQLGAVQQQLESNQIAKASQSQLVTQIQAQHKIWQDWNNLYDLIGSSDGKKFRNFAQGLTFNVMINHANAQLAKMSDRYLLIADSQNPLELNVIDNYQGGEQRTSKNLSGGESFIVSLALALGLSSMASRQVQVDSLFLDEGFGTLDAEALDTALDTLTSLQQSGKLIGVISHVQELKDRITTQILVEKGRGGVSHIVGAGVQKI